MENSKIGHRLAVDLAPLVQGTVRADRLTCAMYSTDASIYQIEPLCVVMPAHRQDVVQVINYAAQQGVPVIARGAGSGLAGEAIGSGIILDMSRYMDQVVSVNLEANQVVVQPGVVLEQLNRRLASVGKQIGPDPASGNRATLGGMIGNNATGAHSLKYGYIGDHLQSIQTIDATGQILEFGQHTITSTSSDTVGRWAGQIYDLLNSNRELIEKVKPRPDRNGSGYNVFSILKDNSINMARLLAGSEGTLAVVTQATLNLVDLPPVKMLLQLNYESLATMARAIPQIIQHDPAACELMDGRLLALARDAYPQYRDVLPDGVGASLLVEFAGFDEADVRKRLQQAHQNLSQLPAQARCVSNQEIISLQSQRRVWSARKAATPLLFRNKSATQPIPVIEDVAVNPEQLAEYLQGLEEITDRLNIPVAFYAHAGDGELHPRPYLNLHQPEDVKKLRQLAEQVFRLVWSLGGTISGEHGEGLVRVSFIKQQYGPEMYEIFRRIKNTFDPHNILNPGKIINDDPDIMVKNLRFSHPLRRREYTSNFLFRDGELVTEIEQCNGNGLCRSRDPQLSMCPIFRATGDEDASPRAKGNLMRHWFYGLLDDDILQTEEFKRIADLCVNCKMCSLECPSLVNIPKLMMEARAEYVKKHGLTRAQFALTRNEFMSRLGSTFGPAANIFLQAHWFRYALQWVLGLDHRRSLPRFGWGSNVKKLRRYLRQQKSINQPVDKVAYFIDSYAMYNDHELGRAVVDILLHNNIEVTIPDQIGASMPAISYGAVDFARRDIEYNVRHMAQAVRAGCKIICSEPTAALCLKEEYLDLVDTPDARLVAENTYELTDYLSQLHREQQLKTDFQPLSMALDYHIPCHYQALKIDDGTESLLYLIEGVQIRRLPESCCGIAGTFGFQKKNFDLSIRAGAPMLTPLRESALEYGLTECGTCKMQMELASGKKVWHPAMIIARAYGLTKK